MIEQAGRQGDPVGNGLRRWRAAFHDITDGSREPHGCHNVGTATQGEIGIEFLNEEALEILAAAKPIADRVRGLRRMGERRWDVMLDRQQIIQLPVKDPVPALERVIALHSARDVLGRDVTVVDMRDGRRPVLRLSVPAVDELYRLRAIADGEDET